MNYNLQNLPSWFSKGEVFAYPTEAVFGLGCDPLNREALYRILALKKRPVEKGVILIASSLEQIKPYVLMDSLPVATQTKIKNSWPGPVTWLLPKSAHTPNWISGDSDMVAVRVSKHPLVCAMCDLVGHAVVSTSANPAGLEPAKTAKQVASYFSEGVNIIEGDLGEQQTPSKIFHSLTLETIRA